MGEGSSGSRLTCPKHAGVVEHAHLTRGRGRERAIAATAFGATEEPLRRVWGPRRRLWRQIWRAFRPRCHARAPLAHAMRPQRSSVLLSRAWPGRFRVPPSLVLAVSGIPVNWLFIWFTGIPLLGYAQEDKSPPAGCLLAGPPGGSSPPLASSNPRGRPFRLGPVCAPYSDLRRQRTPGPVHDTTSQNP